MDAYLALNATFPKNGPTSQPAARNAIVLSPVVRSGSRPRVALSAASYPPPIKKRSPVYVVATALIPEATTLIFRRVRRSVRKRFQVNVWCTLSEGFGGVGDGEAGFAVEARRMSVNGVEGLDMKGDRSVRWNFDDRAHVENGAGVEATVDGLKRVRAIDALAG